MSNLLDPNDLPDEVLRELRENPQTTTTLSPLPEGFTLKVGDKVQVQDCIGLKSGGYVVKSVSPLGEIELEYELQP